MSRAIIQVPIKRRDRAVAEIYHTDPVTGSRGLLGRDYVNQEDPSKNYVEVYDARGKTLFKWAAKSGKPMDQAAFKTATYIAKESFRAKGVA